MLLLLASCGEPSASIGSASLTVRARAEGEPTACTVTVRAIGAPRLVLHDTADGEGQVGRVLAPGVVAVDDTILASTCELRVDLPPGRYAVTVSAGPELDAPSRELELHDGDAQTLELDLARSVDSTGWACADLHVHSAPSVDSTVPLEQRVLGALAEGLDLMAATDHDALGDWAEALRTTGYEGRLVVVPGNEISPGVSDRDNKGHFNVYPVPTDIVLPDAMPHVGLTVEQIFANARTAAPGAILQINHPRSDPWFGYFSRIDFDPITGTGRAGMLASDFDALEVWNGHGLDLRDAEPPVELVLEDWYALLRAGRGVVATGSSDTHRLARTPVGSPRTCVRVADDRPSALDADAFIDSLRVGDAFVTSGPFLDLTVQGQGLGALVAPDDGEVEVAVHVQAADWVPVDRVHIVVDGEEVEVLPVELVPSTVTARVPIARDAFVLVIARGDAPLGDPAGNPAKPMRSMAFTNPVYVDADGDGAWTP